MNASFGVESTGLDLYIFILLIDAIRIRLVLEIAFPYRMKPLPSLPVVALENIFQERNQLAQFIFQ